MHRHDVAARPPLARGQAPGVPSLLVERSIAADATNQEIHRLAARPGTVARQAVAGGGGKGMRQSSGRHLLEAVRRSIGSGTASRPSVYLERRVTGPRQSRCSAGDAHGAVLPFVERECSISVQPEGGRGNAVTHGDPARTAITSAAAAVAKSVGYTNAAPSSSCSTKTAAFTSWK